MLGDTLEAAIGDQIVVDGRALAVQSLQIDESLLTGESDPIEKAAGDEVLSGSFVVVRLGAVPGDKGGPRGLCGAVGTGGPPVHPDQV